MGCLFLNGREVQRTIGVKGRMRGNNKAVERVDRFHWHEVNQRVFFSVPRGRISRTSTAETAPTPAKIPNVTGKGT